jgi:hypothetical protein
VFLANASRAGILGRTFVTTATIQADPAVRFDCDLTLLMFARAGSIPSFNHAGRLLPVWTRYLWKRSLWTRSLRREVCEEKFAKRSLGREVWDEKFGDKEFVDEKFVAEEFGDEAFVDEEFVE